MTATPPRFSSARFLQPVGRNTAYATLLKIANDRQATLRQIGNADGRTDSGPTAA
ncbi:hypothetical protein GGR28_000731 [Lewinella aquimaris]|uniref:Uncharacterized protein n=1 Tax=Neolewinella aquimaris TaxID=1835722 RepID=A0A840DZ02_9BACT|nr:hypothetical protein [Neolewinella aquimaris]MBB4078130.1 hypothetical protein [Neolewinella aquimaris]